MKLRALALGAAVALAACADLPPASPPAPIPKTTAPRCASPVECEQMWVRAQEAVQDLSMMRLRLVSDTRLETFAATRFGYMTGVVLKYPVEPGVYELRASFTCYRGIDCGHQPARAVALFNLTVGGPAVQK